MRRSRRPSMAAGPRATSTFRPSRRPGPSREGGPDPCSAARDPGATEGVMTKAAPVNRTTVDLSGYPDLVVIYLGMKVSRLKGLSVLARTGREIGQAVAARPDGLLRHENMLFSLLPVH